MKRTIFAISLLPLILVGCLAQTSFANKHCNATKQWVEKAMAASQQDDFSQTLQLSTKAKEYWDGHNKIITAILRHDDSGDVGIGLAKMVSFAKMQDQEEFYAVCAEVLEHLEHIREQELPLLENIF